MKRGKKNTRKLAVLAAEIKLSTSEIQALADEFKKLYEEIK